MMAGKTQTKLPSGQSVKWREQEMPSVYANIMGFAMSPFDISIIFGEISEATITEVTAIPKAKVILTPEQAANLMKLLGVALASYISANGQLRTAGAIDMEQLEAQMKAMKTAIANES
jgi:Protein of unknown function (DUF3467)